jgi:hypothetical protein
LDHGNMGVTLFTKLELYVFLCLITAWEWSLCDCSHLCRRSQAIPLEDRDKIMQHHMHAATEFSWQTSACN